MADFAYQNYAEYRIDTGGGDDLIGTVLDTSGTLTDLDNDNTFETLDFYTDFDVGGVPTLISYVGKIEIGGKDYPVFAYTETIPVFGTVPVTVVFFDDDAAIPLTISPDNIQSDTPYPFCFGPQTAIATPTGQTPAEALSAGDLVCTADGRVVPVKWIGRQTSMPGFVDIARRPVRVAAGALGQGLPVRDLIVTADHGLAFDGLIVTAGVLVNGTTIRYMHSDELPARFTVYHVETEDHDVILAEGQPAETFVDYAARQGFDNAAEYVALFGDAAPIRESPMPRVTSVRLLPAELRARLGLDAQRRAA